MKKYLPNLIHCDQSAFASGRYIGHAVRQISDIIEYTAKNNKVGLMFGADFESAFDSTDMEFIVATLLNLVFPQNLLNGSNFSTKMLKAA